jgi:DNA-nicking Smr family endonuclease
MKFNIGDKVAALDEDVTGVVVNVQSDKIEVETSEGFLMTYLAKELIINTNSNELSGFVSREKVSNAIKEKTEPLKRNFTREKKSKKEDFVLEVDLHIEKLVPSKRRMNNYDILNLQMETAKRQLEFAQKNRIPKVVLIHGVGEGVLKAEIDFLLGRFDNISFQEANYQKYGLGATEVYFIQKKMM